MSVVSLWARKVIEVRHYVGEKNIFVDVEMSPEQMRLAARRLLLAMEPAELAAFIEEVARELYSVPVGEATVTDLAAYRAAGGKE